MRKSMTFFELREQLLTLSKTQLEQQVMIHLDGQFFPANRLLTVPTIHSTKDGQPYFTFSVDDS